MSPRLDIPENISIVPLRPSCPELNPHENIWQSCATTGYPTACFPHTRTSSTIAATPGTNSPINPRRPSQSDLGTGRSGSDQRVLVLETVYGCSDYIAEPRSGEPLASHSFCLPNEIGFIFVGRTLFLGLDLLIAAAAFNFSRLALSSLQIEARAPPFGVTSLHAGRFRLLSHDLLAITAGYYDATLFSIQRFAGPSLKLSSR
jgi:hypothetical protein